MPSPSFSKFRQLMDTWDKHCIREGLEELMNGNGLILFFKRGEEVFGAPEDSRVIFAKLKSGDEDDPMAPGFRDEARFMAMNLMKSLAGEPVETMFGHKDLDGLKVCDREEVMSMLEHPPKEDKPKKKKKDK